MSQDPGAEVIERFFDRLMELCPVEATYHGLHQHDHRLPDGTLAGAVELQELLHGFESELATHRDGLDLDLARYYTALTRFRLDDMRLWARMPEAPDQIGTAVFLLFARDFAPLEDRLETIATRLEGVPAYLAASREQVLEPVRLWCEVAATTARQLPDLFSTVVSAAVRDPLRGRLERAAAAASLAAEDFAGWLESAVAPAAPDSWALGEERFARLLELRELPDAPEAILALGRRYLDEVEEERRELLSEVWPGSSVEEVDALVRSQHPADFDAALADYREAIGASRDFVAERGLATLPPGEELRVEPTPAFLRDVIPFAAYEPPARFDQRQLGIYIVTPGNGDLSGHNRAAVLNTSVHEGYPGHHLQFACANQYSSIARLLSADGATELIEGWAHYCEQLMYEQGFSTSPEVRFVQLNDLVWRACRIIIDVELSSGRMSFAEAVDMLVERAAMPRDSAEAEVRRYTYTPGYQLSYLYGKHLLLQLRERRRRLDGAAFDLREFHDRMLYAGPLPAATWDALF
ncbi:MAG TPA: DUF885 domain-containing protein [Candidatus Dormibacteraeota bacterium]